MHFSIGYSAGPYQVHFLPAWVTPSLSLRGKEERGLRLDLNWAFCAWNLLFHSCSTDSAPYTPHHRDFHPTNIHLRGHMGVRAFPMALVLPKRHRGRKEHRRVLPKMLSYHEKPDVLMPRCALDRAETGRKEKDSSRSTEESSSSCFLLTVFLWVCDGPSLLQSKRRCGEWERGC